MSLLFVGHGFYGKGGKEVLEACGDLRKKYDFKLSVVSDVPKELQKKYRDFNFVRPDVPRAELLRKYFSNSDIFVLPSYIDTFGMVFLEAMSAGIPVVASNNFAIPEIVGGAGIMVDSTKRTMFNKKMLFKTSWKKFNESTRADKPEMVQDLKKKISYMIENASARRKMSRAGRAEVSRGKFSIGERNRKLNRIYEESLRR